MKPTKNQIRKWANALRSGEYRQTTACLQDPKGYCCLGVACAIFTPKTDLFLQQNGCMEGGMPEAQPESPGWLKRFTSLFYNDTSVCLYGLNDGKYKELELRGLTFDEIADVLEAIYIHEVLK